MVGLAPLIMLAGLVGLIRPSWLKLKNRWWALGLIVVGIVAAGAGAAPEEQVEPATTPAPQTTTQGLAPSQAAPSAQQPSSAEPAEEPAEEPESAETVSQRNAVRKAQEYLRVMPFSKKGLIEQLVFEGFSTEDATYAVNKLDVDWKEQAVKKAEQYLEIMAFSRRGLIEQLEFEGFTTEEATYAADQLGF